MPEFTDLMNKHMKLPSILDQLSELMLFNSADDFSQIHSRLSNKQPEQFNFFKGEAVDPYVSRLEKSVPEVDIISEYMSRELKKSIQATLDRCIHLSLAGFTIPEPKEQFYGLPRHGMTCTSPAPETGAFTAEELRHVINRHRPPRIEAGEFARKMLARILLKEAGVNCSPDMVINEVWGIKIQASPYLPPDTLAILSYDPDTGEPNVQLVKFDGLGEADGSTK